MKSEFGITIKKKSKHSEMYILSNKYIINKIFLNPFDTAPNANSSGIPRLGRASNELPAINSVRTTDEPYDSDDENE